MLLAGCPRALLEEPPPLSVVRDGFRMLLSPSGAETISKLDGGRTGYYYDLGERIGELRPHATQVVMLGMGGGEMLRAARRTLPDAQLLGVDTSALVLQAARREFRVGDFGASGVVADGRFFVKQVGGIDALIDDMFDDDRMVGATREFFHDCHAALKPRGLLVVNVYPATKMPQVLELLVEAAFEPLERHEVRGSTVVFAERR